MNTTRRRALIVGAVAAGATLAAGIGVRLSGYGVPVTLLLACCLSCVATFSSLLFHVIGTGPRPRTAARGPAATSA